MTPTPSTPTKTRKPASPFAAVAAFIGWVVTTDRAFRRTQSMIDASGIHF